MKIMNQQLHRVTQHIYRLGIAEGFTVQSCQIVTQPRVSPSTRVMEVLLIL
jgi:hypothetical protein